MADQPRRELSEKLRMFSHESKVLPRDLLDAVQKRTKILTAEAELEACVLGLVKPDITTSSLYKAGLTDGDSVIIHTDCGRMQRIITYYDYYNGIRLGNPTAVDKYYFSVANQGSP